MRRLFIALALLFAAGPALAKDIQHTPAGVRFTVPDNWDTEDMGPTVHTVAPDEGAYILFLGFPSSEIDQRVNELTKVLEEVKITDFEGGEPSEGTLNGMAIVTVDGKGRFEGKAVELGVVFVVPPGGDKALIVFGITDGSGNDKAIEKILMSLKPL